jgi:hypothetical protein
MLDRIKGWLGGGHAATSAGGGKSELQANAEKALEMKRQAGPQTNIPEHQTSHEGGVQGSQINCDRSRRTGETSWPRKPA